MAFYIFKIKPLPFPKPLILIYLLLMFIDFFSPLRPFTSALHFNFPSFNSCDYPLRCERARAYDQVIRLIPNNLSFEVGQATSFSPMHLWDKASGNLTDFTTNFSFVIDSQNNVDYGNGLAFYLAPPDGPTIQDVSQGSTMGLIRYNETFNSTNNAFVAVEFDIYSNTWDPPYVHVDIDINSMESVANVSWLGGNISIMEGRINEARIIIILVLII
jgi:hypothetical protein